MADENSTPKKSLKDRLPSVNLGRTKESLQDFQKTIKRYQRIIFWGSAVLFVIGLFLGARLHELGALEVMGISLKGSTVKVSGSCSVDNEPRGQALLEDEVSITAIDSEKFEGVIRKTREVVVCQRKDVSIAALPIFSDLRGSPVAAPEITLSERKQKTPLYKLLENRILLISGTCKSQADLKEIPPFTDERVDVTAVDASKDNADIFIISGIRRSDKLAIACSSRSIRYTVTDGSEPIAPEMPKVPVTFIGKTVLVTSKCVPDPNVRVPRGADGRKVSFYRLVNTEVQVISEELRNDKLYKFQGSITDKKSEGFGQLVVCDQSKFPFTAPLKESEEDVMLERSDAQKARPETSNSTIIETEEEPTVTTTPKAPAGGTVVPKAQEQKQEAPMTQEQEKEMLFKQLDNGGTDGK